MSKSFIWLTLAAGATGLLAQAASAPAQAQSCTSEQFAVAVDDAGAALRDLMRQTQPRLDARIKTLQTKFNWSTDQAEEKTFELLNDKRTAELDRAANDLLAKMDDLGAVRPGAAPECSRLEALQAASIELQATVKAKSAYLISRADALIGTSSATGPSGGGTAASSPPTSAAAAAAVATPTPAVKATPPATSWTTTTTIAEAAPIAPPQQPTAAQPNQDDDAFSVDDIMKASTGLFGKVSAGLGSIVEHAFSKIGRPTGYILGEEGGGAFLAGVRYGRGTLYMRDGRTAPVFWHGPSIGWDVGAQSSKVVFLAYRLRDPEQLMLPFTSLEGSAFVAGGVGLNLMTNGGVQLSPIRSGLGLRVGASVGYVRFTRKPTWNPF